MGIAGFLTVSSVAPATDPPDQPQQPGKTDPTRSRTSQAAEHAQQILRLDLSPGVEVPLVVDHIQDEGATVQAADGKVFVILPVRYDPQAGPAAFSKNLLRGPCGQGFYGLRVMQVRDRRPVVEPTEPDPIYERIELKEPGAGRYMLAARNSLGPRRIEKGKPRQEHLQDRARPLPASGWLAIVIETGKAESFLRLQWADKHEDTLDLDFLGRALRGPRQEDFGDPSSRAVSAMIRQLDGSCSAMASLAILRLAAVRKELDSDPSDAWFEKVESKVLPAAARREQNIQEAVWSYAASRRRLPDAAVRLIAKQKPAVLAHWVRLAGAGLAGELDKNTVVATQILGVALRSDNQGVCEAAWAVLTKFEAELDWDLLGGFSEKAQGLAVARLGEERDKSASTRLLVVLARDIRPADAARIAAQTERLQIRLGSPQDPLLAQWWSLKEDGAKAALLTVLAAVDLGDVAYSQPFAELVDQATAPGAEASVREACCRLLIRQMDRSLQGPETAGGKQAEAGAVRLHGQYPVRLPDRLRDPLVKGLAQAATGGAEETRLDALALLLEGGYADEAYRAVVRSFKSGGDGEAMLKRLMQRRDVGNSFGSCAMLGRLLCGNRASINGTILEHLDRTAKELAPADRWQLCAAVKAEVNLEKWPARTSAGESAESRRMVQWLHTLGHFTAQDGQRLASSSDEKDWISRLQRINARRALLLDGRYGVLAVLETSVCEERQNAKSGAGSEDATASPESLYRWSAPRRVTVALPPLRIESNELDNRYRVLWGQRAIGEGVVRAGGQEPPQTASHSLRLTAAGESMLGPDGWGWRSWKPPGQAGESVERIERAVGPALVRSGENLSSPEPNVMVLDIGEYLTASLQQSNRGAAALGGADKWMPKKLPITLRYTAFGNFSGAATQAPFPARPKSGQRHLLNVAIILERMD